MNRILAIATTIAIIASAPAIAGPLDNLSDYCKGQTVETASDATMVNSGVPALEILGDMPACVEVTRKNLDPETLEVTESVYYRRASSATIAIALTTARDTESASAN